MENFGKFMAVLLGMIISPIISGFVVVKLWAWFIVPIFEANPIRIVEAIGIMALIYYIRSKRDKNAKADEFWDNYKENIAFVIFMSGYALLFGWIVHLFM
jgi:MFS family permease